jgi:hypothetical protein
MNKYEVEQEARRTRLLERNEISVEDCPFLTAGRADRNE